MNDYNIKNDRYGNKIFVADIRWTDINGKDHFIESADINKVQSIIELLKAGTMPDQTLQQ